MPRRLLAPAASHRHFEMRNSRNLEAMVVSLFKHCGCCLEEIRIGAQVDDILGFPPDREPRCVVCTPSSSLLVYSHEFLALPNSVAIGQERRVGLSGRSVPPMAPVQSSMTILVNYEFCFISLSHLDYLYFLLITFAPHEAKTFSASTSTTRKAAVKGFPRFSPQMLGVCVNDLLTSRRTVVKSYGQVGFVWSRT